MKLRKTIRSHELEVGDEVALYEGRYRGIEIGKINTTRKGKIMVYCQYNDRHLIFGQGLDPQRKVVIIVEGEPPVENGFYEI